MVTKHLPVLFRQQNALTRKTTAAQKELSGRLAEEPIGEISGDRRARRRYSMELPAEYQITENRLVVGRGSGNTVNLSSTGLAFASSGPVKVGSQIKLLVCWPALSLDCCSLQMIVYGTVVRTEGCITAIRMSRFPAFSKGSKRDAPSGESDP